MDQPDLVPALPRFVQIEPVGQCNLRCRMCPVQFRGEGRSAPPAFMAFDSFRILLDQFEGLSELHLQGLGEPLLHPRFFDMATLAARRGIKVSTNTNMTVMTEEQAQQCVDAGIDTVHVSIDAPTPAAYEAVRLGARLPLVLRNVRRLVAARDGRAKPGIVLVAVLMRSTLDGLPQLVELAAGLGVDSMSVQQLCHDFSEHSLRRATGRCVTSSMARCWARPTARTRKACSRWRGRGPMRSVCHCGCRAWNPGNRSARTSLVARAATGPGAAPTSATTALPCRAAWLPRRIGHSLATC
jgi:molybdenum cofactor biosynthesis enzyme MoaA